MSEDGAFRVPVPVRFSDIDALGHVNNAVYLTYMEIARVAFCRDVLGAASVADLDFVVARIEIDYRKPVRLGDDLTCAISVERIGDTAYTLRYTLAAGDAVAASARSVQVFFDPGTLRPKPVPPGFAARVAPFMVTGS